MSYEMNIWEFNRVLANRLLRNNLVNIWIGNRLRNSENDFLRGVGTQAVGWGIINIGIAIFGLVTTRRRLDESEDPFDTDLVRKETRNIRLALLVNTPLNFLYMLGGWRFARSGGKDNKFRKGNGWGIILQGAMLFIHDYYHLRNVPKKPGKDQ